MSFTKILGISGSLRKDSYNTALINNARSLLPKDTELVIFDRMADIPLFNQDMEAKLPKAVEYLKKEIGESDAILFATPEYNYSVPGVLKNMIDWASRPYGQSAWNGKPAAIMSAATGMIGGARAQYHLRQIFVFLNMYPLNKPEVIVPEADKKFDGQGRLTDIHTKDKISQLLQALVEWTRKLENEQISPKALEEDYPYDLAYASQQSGENKFLEK